MAIQSRKNQYMGVNAHLMSILQTPGTSENMASWPGFHGHQIAYIMDSLNTKLPKGYIAVNEQSLQILGEYGEGFLLRKQPLLPDVMIFQKSAFQASSQGVSLSVPTGQAAYDETPVEEDYTSGVIIYQQTGQGRWGIPVTRIEVLSRSNKPGGSNYPDYRKKRQETFLSGIPLIEIDFLHESHSPVIDLPIYPDESGSYPYTITVSDPRMGASRVRVSVYGFNVDASFPVVPIPLVEAEMLGFNLGEAYQNGYERGPWNRLVDYAVLPERFETYSPADQARIQARMAAVKKAVDEGKDLEQGPFEI